MYTLGERHGFTITKKGISDAPYYVIGKDIKNNILIVSSSPEVKTKSQEIKLVDCVWRELETDKTYTAQIRYHGELKSCRIIRTKNDYSIIFDESDATIAQGQSVVLYDNSVCIGGGVVA
jgi:tRNA-specific 2-thiouridylase